MKNKQAFTLIELLVVVLIIGILAAVALPQYQKAVEKSRLTEALANIATLQKAIDIYVLENGYQNIDFSKIDVELSGVSCDGLQSCSSNYYIYAIWGGKDSYCNINVTRLNESYYLETTKSSSTEDKWAFKECDYNIEDTKDLCESLVPLGWTAYDNR